MKYNTGYKVTAEQYKDAPTTSRKAYIFIWNPITWPWDIDEAINEVETTGKVEVNWKCGNTKSISIGDRIFLIKLASKPKGMIASGRAISKPVMIKKWGGLYTKIEFDILFNPDKDPILPIEVLQTGKLAKQGTWTPQASGISIKPELVSALEKKWSQFLKKQGILYEPAPAAITDAGLYSEGSANQIMLTRYERNADARNKCLKHYGYTCVVCNFNFEKFYGNIGSRFIHVHHLKSIATIGKEYKIDPVADLRPVCANCHAMLHKRQPQLTIEELKKLLRK